MILVDDDTDDGAGGPQPVAVAAKRTMPDRIGARLGAARIAAKVELVDIARDTRVPVRHLRAIEADAHDELPALPYAIGFVKSFARAVGMDADEAAARFRAETTMVPHAPMAVKIEPLDERRLPSRGLIAASVAGLVLILGGLTAYGAGWFDAAVQEPVQVAVESPPVVPPAPAGPPAATAADAAAGAATPAAATDGMAAPAAAVPDAALIPGAGVSIVASDDAWIRITRWNPETAKVESVKTGLLAKGERYDVPAGTTGLRLWTGRAGALKISVDGRAVPSLGGPVETVKNVDLDAAALRARVAPAAAATGPAAVQ